MQIAGVEPIPADVADEEHRLHDEIVEEIVAGDDTQLERYLSGEVPSAAELERTLAGELLMGAGGGLGVTLQTAQIQQRLDVILVTVAITALLGFAINQIIARVRREVLRWQPVSI